MQATGDQNPVLSLLGKKLTHWTPSLAPKTVLK